MFDYPRYLYRAPLVITGPGQVIEDGGVITEDGLVTAVGRYADLKSADAELEEYGGHVILPSLLNCHAHLELSVFGSLGQAPVPEGGITGWIRALLALRAENPGEELIHDAAIMALARLYAGGCRLVLDIGNQEASSTIGQGFKTESRFFLELLGLCGASEQAALARLADLPEALACTAHAPYSCGPELLQAIKTRANGMSQLLPIHVAESAEEVEFLHAGSGPFRDFLLARGLELGGFQPPGLVPIAYLDSLGLLDQHTLCVHGVHLSEEEIALLAERQANLCLCPGSNRQLGVGIAPAEALFAAGVPLVLGTDSLASNPSLSLWQEMATLRQDHPGLAPAAVLAMATANPAKLLGVEERMGIIAPGVSSALLAVECPATNPAAALDYLTSAGSDIRLEWLE
ncbi:MAG: amidohydrolase family protein [Thermodesulfobacteriota bacterium]